MARYVTINRILYSWKYLTIYAFLLLFQHLDEQLLLPMVSFTLRFHVRIIPILYLLFINSQTHILGFSKGYKEAFLSGDQEPWLFRGGLTGELQVCF